MKKIKTSALPLWIILFGIGFGTGYATKDLAPEPKRDSQTQLIENTISVCFTPNKQCQTKIIHAINAATKSIYVQAYSFTDPDIANALADATSRNVDVKILLDKSNRNHAKSAIDILIERQIPFRFDAPQGIAHNKIIIIDEKKVLTGSYNFSAAAYKRNTENLLIIDDANLAHHYLQNWQERWNVSK